MFRVEIDVCFVPKTGSFRVDLAQPQIQQIEPSGVHCQQP